MALMVCVLVLGLAAGVSPATAAHAAPPTLGQEPPAGSERRQGGDRRIKWWTDEKSRQELGITDQQSADIEQIFQSTLPTLRQARRELEDLESKLSQMIKDGTASVAAVTEQVERVENARAEMNKTRTIMLYRIDRVLSAEQRAKLKTWYERERSHRSGGGSRPH